MISKPEIHLIKQLQRKKVRDDHHLFVAEGPKIVAEILNLNPSTQFKISILIGTEGWINENMVGATNMPDRIEMVTSLDLERISLLQSPNQVLALVNQPAPPYQPTVFEKGLYLILDEIQDPGNTGTIIRLADWFGFQGVIGTTGTADFFGPKVIQSSMGSFMRMNLYNYETERLIEQIKSEERIYGTNLVGNDIYATKLESSGMIIMGNESKGISPLWHNRVNQWLKIPAFSPFQSKAESLNVATATAIICSEFRRRAIV